MKQIPFALALQVLSSLLLVACDDGDPGGAGTPEAADAADARGAGDPTQTPPQGKANLDPWLEAAHHRSWRCEASIMDARPKGAHGRNRVCSNALLSGASAAPYPVGAAAVKELFDSQDRQTGVAVAVKIAPGAGASTWYWYERIGGSTAADGVGAGVCAGCHGTAPGDNIFIQVK
jgi:hypothetical protein